MFGTPYFNEGWALYSERVMRERGFFTEPLQELYHLNATIFRAARIVVDTSLHLGDMSHDEAVDLHVDEDGAAGGDGPRRGRTLLRLADAGLRLPHRLPADPRDSRAIPRRRAASGGKRHVHPSPIFAPSTTRWPHPAACRSGSPSGQSCRPPPADQAGMGEPSSQPGPPQPRNRVGRMRTACE